MKRRVTRIALFLWLTGGLGAAAAQEVAPFDPYKAEKNVEVGLFYFKKKNYDAAIERFKEAIRHKPNFARAHLLLGKCYDKKREKTEAIVWYKKYLEILPSAEDAETIRKRIQKLGREIEQETERRKRHSG